MDLDFEKYGVEWRWTVLVKLDLKLGICDLDLDPNPIPGLFIDMLVLIPYRSSWK